MCHFKELVFYPWVMISKLHSPEPQGSAEGNAVGSRSKGD